MKVIVEFIKYIYIIVVYKSSLKISKYLSKDIYKCIF